jgi:F-type H+-transporting ATPase subunit alpha
VQLYAATNGFLDRLLVERVSEFLARLTESMHAEQQDLRAKIAGGDWSDETQTAVQQAVSAFASDFGYDLDEEGQPLDENAPLEARPPARGSDGSGHETDGSAGESEPAGALETQPA